jgi:uncharacterized protein (AIM24 family)
LIELPVPLGEIQRVKLNGTKMKISDRGKVIMRIGDIRHTVTKSTKNVVAAKATGEGIVQRYEGHGEVWISPTMGLLDLMVKRYEH